MRFTDEEYNSVLEGAKKDGLDVSKYSRGRILCSGMAERNTPFDKRELRKMRNKKTELHYDLFHPSNTLQTIIKMSKGSFILHRGEDINMKPIIAVIKEANKVYSALPKEERKLISADMKKLNELKDPNILRKILGIAKYVKIDDKTNADLLLVTSARQIERPMHKNEDGQ